MDRDDQVYTPVKIDEKPAKQIPTVAPSLRVAVSAAVGRVEGPIRMTPWAVDSLF
jgi:hypothetical protein